jgi:ribosomal protein S18
VAVPAASGVSRRAVAAAAAGIAAAVRGVAVAGAGTRCASSAPKKPSLSITRRALLNQFIADAGRIHSRRRTGTCAKHQRMLAKAIKRARQIALLPYTSEHGRRLRSS